MKKPSSTFSHQKRFGQYFSGDKVAALLSLLLLGGMESNLLVPHTRTWSLPQFSC